MFKSFDDTETDIVYFTQALSFRYPSVFWPAKLNLEANGITVKTVAKTRNVWIRDYFPIQVNGNFYRFQYGFGERHKKYPQLDISNEPWTGVLPVPIRESQIILDGGNIVQGAGKIILTDAVIRDNGKGVVGRLEKLLQSEIIIIPMEPGDDLGHSDGICKIINEKTVLINDYTAIFDKDKRFADYMNSLRRILEGKGFNIEIIPYGYGDWDWEMTEQQFRQVCPDGDDFSPGFGYYINFLIVKNTILFPAMRINKDAHALRVLKYLYPDFNIIAIDCSRLSLEGGLLHCVSVNYEKGNMT